MRLLAKVDPPDQGAGQAGPRGLIHVPNDDEALTVDGGPNRGEAGRGSDPMPIGAVSGVPADGGSRARPRLSQGHAGAGGADFWSMAQCDGPAGRRILTARISL